MDPSDSFSLAVWLAVLPLSGGDGARFAGVSSESIALAVDPTSGHATRLSGVGMEGYGAVRGLTFDASTGTLYGVDANTHELLTIDPETRQGTPVGGMGFTGIGSIAFDGVRRVIHAIESVGGGPDRLIRIDPLTGQGTLVGSTGIADVGGLAFDAASGILYATDVGTADTLLRLNRDTGQASTVGALGFVWVGTLCMDGSTLRGVDLQSDRLLTIDKSTGQGTAASSSLGAGGFHDVRGLAFDPATATLFGMDAATAQLIRIERSNGSATALGPLGLRGVRALTYAASVGALYATDAANDKLLVLNPLSGEATVVGNLLDPGGNRLYEVFGLAWNPSLHRLYGVDRASKRLLRLDRSTGRATSALALTYPGGQSIFGLRTLAFDTHTRTLLGVDSNGIDSRLVRLDPATGVGTLVAPASPMPFANVHGLVYAAHARLLIATTDNGSTSAPVRKLITIHPATGHWSELATLAMGAVYGLAYDPASRFVAGTTGAQLYLLDAIGQATTFGALGITEIEGLALDSSTGVLYGTTVGNAEVPTGRLVTVDPVTGVGTPRAALADALGNPYTAVAGLACDPATGTLYGADTLRDQLVRIHRLTGRVTVVGALGFQEVQGLAFHAASGLLYGVDGSTRQLLRIDTTTGRGTALGALGFPDVEGLEADPVTGFLYGTDVQTLQLIRIDRVTGAGTALGSTAYKVDGLAGRLP